MPQKEQRHSLRRGLTITGFVVLILISLGLIFNQQIKNWMVSSYQPEITQSSIKDNAKKKTSYNFSNVKSLDFSTVAKARLNAKDIHVVGEMIIPASNVHLPIGNGVTNETLALTAATMRPDQKMGENNYPLAGHHMVAKNILFSPLYWKTQVGQKIYLTNKSQVFEYKVNVRKFIKATDVQVVNPTKQKMVTLITCDATGANRLMIRGKYVTKMAYKDAPNSVKEAFAAKFNN